MRCPRCGGARIVLAAAPGEQPGAVRVCLECAALWEARPEEEAASAAAGATPPG